MKRILIVTVLLMLLVFPAFSQVRLDLGVVVPVYFGALGFNSGDTEVDLIGMPYIIPFPEAGVYYQINLGMIKICAGVRAFTLILETILWPDIMAELELGPVILQAHVGGLFFAMFGVAQGTGAGQVIIPDVSAWFGFGQSKKFRVGIGVIGLMVPELSADGMIIAPYAGIKAVIGG
ncbi:MAG: hypothetical protein JW874_07845 [Spirochaetales bacterium]|nr:hypothetical protein [Spirochaetales bacterium]